MYKEFLMRTTTINAIASLIIIGVHSSVSAAPITIDFGVKEIRRDLSSPQPQIPTPVLISFAARQDPPGGTLKLASWNVSADVADVGSTWFLTEATAQPEQWDDFSDSFKITHEWFFRSNIGPPPSTGLSYGKAPQPSPATRFRINSLESVELRLIELFTSPVGSIVRWQHLVHGDGEIIPVPEPAQIAMLLLTWPLFLSLRSRGDQSTPGAHRFPGETL